MIYLITTDPSIAPSAIESWAMGVAAIEYIAALPSRTEPVKVYARAETDAEWRVLSFRRVGKVWNGTWVSCVPTTASDPLPTSESKIEGPSEIESLRAELREVRERCAALCDAAAARWRMPTTGDAASRDARRERGNEAAALAAEIRALSENAPPR